MYIYSTIRSYLSTSPQIIFLFFSSLWLMWWVVTCLHWFRYIFMFLFCRVILYFYCIRQLLSISPMLVCWPQRVGVYFIYERILLYRMSQEECAKIRESVPNVKIYRYNPKHLYPKLNGYGDIGERSLKL
jgi:hypothetical protein